MIIRFPLAALCCALLCSTLASGQTLGPNEDWTGGVAFFGSTGTFLGDLNADGKKDILVVNGSSVSIRFANSTGTAYVNQMLLLNNFSFQRLIAFADVTGDGRADLIAVNNTNINVWIANSSGNGFTASTPTAFSTIAYFGTDGTWFSDINFDGIADAVVRNGSQIVVRLSNGSSFGSNIVMTNSAAGENTVFGDFDADGRTDAVDFVYVAPGTWHVMFYKNNGGSGGVALNSPVQQNQHIGDSFVSGGLVFDMPWTPYAVYRTNDFFCDVVIDYTNLAHGHVDLLTGSSGGGANTFSSVAVISSFAYFGDKFTDFGDSTGDNLADGVVCNTNTGVVLRR
jgi:hypothetical protein